MVSTFSLSIVVPLWNEEANVVALVRSLGDSRTVREFGATAVLVDNGSADATGRILDELAATEPWMRVIHLAENLNYGGGILEGVRQAAGEYICYLPGDLQYSGYDLDRVVTRLYLHHQEGGRNVLVKGKRTTRADGAAASIVSWTYTVLAKAVLGLGIDDVNGLPKAFHRSLLALLPTRTMINFVFDAQLLHCASMNRWKIEEIEVTFHKRNAGVSSWSGRRVHVYVRSLRDLFVVRRLGAAGRARERQGPRS